MNKPTPNLPAPPGNIFRQTIFRARLIWRLLRDRRVHWVWKLIPVAGAVSVVIPLDVLPDLVPIIGQIDDVGIFLGSLALFMELCPDDVVKEHWDDLTAVNVKGTWKETDQEKLPGPAEGTAEKPQ